ncbi:MAG TPA: hypothetical protein VG010_04865 [Solirubrobacteraceae bacterium]|nr:hypothetical protein [Solirubrobacteraceae bacterium]
MAAAVAFLACEDARYITVQALSVRGGLTMARATTAGGGGHAPWRI